MSSMGRTTESTQSRLLGTDEAGRTPTIKSEEQQGPGPMAKLQYQKAKRPQRHGPEQRIFGDRIPRDELEWRQIGSGMWARSFIGMSKLLTTTRSGPQESEVERRIIRDVDTGKVIDDCVPHMTSDAKLYRELVDKKNIRVELVMKDAAKWFRQRA